MRTTPSALVASPRYTGLPATSARISVGLAKVNVNRLTRRAMLIQVLYSVRSERQLMEQTQYNLLFRWFIGLAMDDAVWVPTVFSKNRERLIEHDAVIEFFNQIVRKHAVIPC